MSNVPRWYTQERFVIPLFIVLGVLAMLGAKALSEQDTVGAVMQETFLPGAPSAAKAIDKSRLTRPDQRTPPGTAPPGLPPVVAYTSLTGTWRAKYVQAGDEGDFSDYRIEQSGSHLSGGGATFSKFLNESAELTITGSVTGREVRFVEATVVKSLLWCDGCEYEGTVNEELTRIEMVGRCGGVCSGIGGTMVLERLPPDQPSILD